MALPGTSGQRISGLCNGNCIKQKGCFNRVQYRPKPFIKVTCTSENTDIIPTIYDKDEGDIVAVRGYIVSDTPEEIAVNLILKWVDIYLNKI